MRLGPSSAKLSASRNGSTCQLKSPGWSAETRRSLEQILIRGAYQGLPVVFDFDNTIVSGDAGEAVLAFLAASGRLTPTTVSSSLCPAIHAGSRTVELQTCSDIMEYYEAFLTPTVHGKADPTPLANGYIWATQVLENLTLAEVLNATASAFEIGKRDRAARIEVTPGKSSYPAPRFHAEMVELISELLRLGYVPWIVSASNVWSVRWMVVYGLNPLLAQCGLRKGLSPKQVIGLATLLCDSKGRLYKDSVLARDEVGYADLKSKLVDSLRVTRHVQFPAPVYSGKVACILDAIGRNPYLCAGDSPSDHPMLCLSQHRLWISRPDKVDALRATKALARRAGNTGWFFQPFATLTN